MIGKAQIFGGPERCSHNLRLHIPGKSKICLVCHCNKIDDLVMMESRGNGVSSESISEIIHQFKVINSVLDVPIDDKLVNTLYLPVLQTSLRLLKLHNDEVGAVVAQALDKISQRVPVHNLEGFLSNLSDQILEKISYGNLNCLSVLIRRKECLNMFLESHVQPVLETLFKNLELHVSGLIPSSAAACYKIFTNESKEINDKENWPSVDVSTTNTMAFSGWESLKIIEKLFDVIDESCPCEDATLVFATINEDNERKRLVSSQQEQQPYPDHQQRKHPSQQALAMFTRNMKGIISACMSLLNSADLLLDMVSFSVKILYFLEKLSRYRETLRLLFADGTGVAFFSMIKKLFYTHSPEVKIAALQLVNRMVVTYNSVMAEEHADKTFIAHFPTAISQVDLIHFIGEAMNTSCENLFRAAIQVLDQINLIPLFRIGRMVPVLESALRIASMHIPDKMTAYSTYLSLNNLITNILFTLESIPIGIQRQLIYLFEKLPNEWTMMQNLSWIKLLHFCSSFELQEKLLSIFHNFVHRSKNLGSCLYVIQLKCVLLIAHALMKRESSQASNSLPDLSKQQQPLSHPEDLAKHLIQCLMDPSFLPSILALVEHGAEDDSMYIAALLEILKHYPEEGFSISYNQPTFETIASDVIRVTFGSEAGQDMFQNEKQQDLSYSIKVDRNTTIKINDVECWSAKTYMNILMSVRRNPNFITCRPLFNLWNENVARVISICSPMHLPQLKKVCLNGLSILPKQENTASSYANDDLLHFDQPKIKQVLEKLDLDITLWSRSIGINELSTLGINSLEKSKHNIILAVYFFFSFFAGCEVGKLLDENLVQRLCELLKTILKKYQEEQDDAEYKIFNWIDLSFQYRVALMILSAIPYSDVKLEQFSDLLETFNLEIDATKFTEDVLVCHCDVFVFLLRSKAFPAEIHTLLEKWMQIDRLACISFYSNANYDEEELNSEINNSLLVLAAKGSPDASDLAVVLGCKRLKKFNLTFPFSYVSSQVHFIIRQILDISSVPNSQVDAIVEIPARRLANLLKLAVEDSSLFCSEHCSPIPVDLLRMMIDLMLRFSKKFVLRRYCLEFLTKALQDDQTFQRVNPYLITHQTLVTFLGSKLDFWCTKNIDETAFAYKLLARLITENLTRFVAINYTYGQAPWISWNLTSVIMHLHRTPKVEVLEFLLAICKTRFKCPLIQVQELQKGSIQFVKIISNLIFHLQALSQVVTTKKSCELIWGIISEILELAKEGKELMTNSELHQEMLFHPAMKMAIQNTLLDCFHLPHRIPLKALEFLQAWTKMLLLDKLENPRNRSPKQQVVFVKAYADLIDTIGKGMKKRPSRSTALAGHGTPNKYSQSLSQWNDVFEIERKSRVIAQIAKNCDIFLATGQ